MGLNKLHKKADRTFWVPKLNLAIKRLFSRNPRLVAFFYDIV